MLLVIDAGNTNIVLAVFKDNKIIGKWRISSDHHRTDDEYASVVSQLMALHGIDYKKIKNVIVSSVVPQCVFPIRMFCRNFLKCEALIVGESNLNLSINVKIDRPSEVGADRLVNSVAARNMFGNNLIIVDFGTATTFDVLNEKGDYIGGVISPGVNLSLEALHMAAAKLPEVEIARPQKVVGTSTVGAMQSGVFWGYVGLVEGVVNKIKQERNSNPKVIATGGLAGLFDKGTEIIDHLEPDLTIYGLRDIFGIN